MDSAALCGTDTLIINNTVQGGLADGDFFTADFPDNIANMKIGKEGNVMVALNQNGRRAECKVRFVRGSKEDKAMNSQVANFLSNPAGFTFITAEFIKKVGDGSGKIASDNYVASAGVPSKLPPVKGNAEGDADQGVSVYELKFGKCARIIA